MSSEKKKSIEKNPTSYSFESIYSEDKDNAYSIFLLHAQDFLEGFGANSISVDLNKLATFIKSLEKKSFPANGGYSKSSPFKKAAFFYVRLHECNPFSETINCNGKEVNGVSEFDHSMASLIGFSFVQRCLLGATVLKNDGNNEIIKEPIAVSDHYLKDLIEASRGITMEKHFRTYSLLFESLCYIKNSNISYKDKEVKIEEKYEWEKSERMYPGLGVFY